MATTININISGYGVKTTTESSDTRHLLEYSERQWQEDNFYTLLPGFSPVGYLHSERKLKKKKKKNCTNGQVCGFSCISKTKTCIANMTTAQLKEHNKAKRLAAAEKRKAAKAAKGGAKNESSDFGLLLKTDPDSFDSFEQLSPELRQQINSAKALVAGTLLKQEAKMYRQIQALNDSVENNLPFIKIAYESDMAAAMKMPEYAVGIDGRDTYPRKAAINEAEKGYENARKLADEKAKKRRETSKRITDDEDAPEVWAIDQRIFDLNEQLQGRVGSGVDFGTPEIRAKYEKFAAQAESQMAKKARQLSQDLDDHNMRSAEYGSMTEFHGDNWAKKYADELGVSELIRSAQFAVAKPI